MLRVLRTDLYRLFRSRSFYVYPAFLCLTLILSLMFSYTNGHTVETGDGKQTEDSVNGFNDGFAVEIELNTDKVRPLDDNKPIMIGWNDLLESLYDGLTLIFMAIVLMIFSTSETRRGFIKNSVGCVKNREYMVLSKMFIGIVITVIYTAEYAVMAVINKLLRALISGNSLQWEAFPEGEGWEIAGFYIVCFCVDLAYIAILLLVHEIFSSRAIEILLAFMLTAGVIEQMVHGIIYMLRQFFGILTDFNVGKYLLLENISGGYGKAECFPGSISIMCLIYILGCTILALWVFRKKDIR